MYLVPHLVRLGEIRLHHRAVDVGERGRTHRRHRLSQLGVDHLNHLLRARFAKRAEHSYGALASIGELVSLDRPILVGPSRKSFLAPEDDAGPTDREWETAAAVTAAVLGGAHIVRVHQVAELGRVVRVVDRILARRSETDVARKRAPS